MIHLPFISKIFLIIYVVYSTLRLISYQKNVYIFIIHHIFHFVNLKLLIAQDNSIYFLGKTEQNRKAFPYHICFGKIISEFSKSFSHQEQCHSFQNLKKQIKLRQSLI